MENEVKEVIYIAIAAMVLSMVLGVASFVMKIRDDLADIRNNQVTANQQVTQYNRYNKYNKNTLIGDEVIECIRLYYDTGIDIFIDNRKNIESNATINRKTTCSISGCIDHRIFNMHQFIKHSGTTQDYFDVAEALSNRPRNDLRNWFPTDSRYRAYLVYNSEDVTTYYEYIMDRFDSTAGYVTGDAATNRLDSFVKEPIPGSEVTGIILVNLNTYGGN